jgi:hypothetical protein
MRALKGKRRMRILVGIAAFTIVVCIFLDGKFGGGSKPLTTASIATSNFSKSVSISRADWQRGGIGGAVAVAEFGVRNNNDFPVRIESVTCVFRNANGTTEERTASTYEVVPTRGQKTMRDLGFGFIDAELKSECHVTKALKA